MRRAQKDLSKKATMTMEATGHEREEQVLVTWESGGTTDQEEFLWVTMTLILRKDGG